MEDGRTEHGSPPLRVVHRRYVPYSHAHYAGDLVDGAYSLGLFGDVATELCIRHDGDEGLFASYSDVAVPRAGPRRRRARGERRAGTTRHPVTRAGLHGDGRRAGPARGRRASAHGLLAQPLVATTARGTVVVPG